jgi:hypothetical protein
MYIIQNYSHNMLSSGNDFCNVCFRASKSAVAGLLPEYVEAESRGKGDGGECWRYHRDCPKSLFKWKSRYERYLPKLHSISFPLNYTRYYPRAHLRTRWKMVFLLLCFYQILNPHLITAGSAQALQLQGF